MHHCIAGILEDELSRKSNDFSIKSMGIEDNKEQVCLGKYYDKAVDITVLFKNKPISGIGFKFITSNYKQNSNNYFENMLGETANLRRNDFAYAQILVFKHKMPYYSSDKKTFTKIERITQHNLSKYCKLHFDSQAELFHRPDLTFLSFIETGDEDDYLKIVGDFETGSPRTIEKLGFHKSIAEGVKAKFITSDELTSEGYEDEFIDYFERVSDFDNFIRAFIHLTKSKIYGR